MVTPFRFLVMSGAVAAAGLFAGCSGPDDLPPAATAALTLDKDRVPLGGPLDLTYRFQPDAVLDGDYRVFVHVESPDGTLMWTDDHDPQPATSAWRVGEPVEYTRTVFVPLFPYLGEASIRLGLHRGDERLPLSSALSTEIDREDRAYTVATLQLLPQSESVFLIYGNGWHPAEYSNDDPSKSWQWTEQSAGLTFRNPRRDVTLFLQYDTRTDAFGDTPQRVTISAGTQPIETFTADNRDPILRRIVLKASDLGIEEMSEIRIAVDRTFSPSTVQSGSTDTRELGIRVYHVYVEPR
jgi:hypothetical protein